MILKIHMVSPRSPRVSSEQVDVGRDNHPPHSPRFQTLVRHTTKADLQWRKVNWLLAQTFLLSVHVRSSKRKYSHWKSLFLWSVKFHQIL